MASPFAPGEGAAELLLAVAAGEAAVMGAQQASALGWRNGLDITFPGVGEGMARAARLVEPGDLVRPTEEDAAQHEAEDVLGVSHRIAEPERAAPAAAEDDPPGNAQRLAKALDVGDEVPGGVLGELGMRRAAPGALLVEEDDPVVRRIEEAPVAGQKPAARAATEEDDGNAARITDLLVIEVVPRRDGKEGGAVGFDRAKEVALGHRDLLDPASSIRLRLSRHDLDLDGGAERQAGGLNRCPGRIWCPEIARVNRVDRAEILHIREVDGGLHHVVEGLPRRFQHG
jgi:hypothetical protein